MGRKTLLEKFTNCESILSFYTPNLSRNDVNVRIGFWPQCPWSQNQGPIQSKNLIVKTNKYKKMILFEYLSFGKQTTNAKMPRKFRYSLCRFIKSNQSDLTYLRTVKLTKVRNCRIRTYPICGINLLKLQR